ncbi:MAG: cobalamin-dependent protein [bacterium]
MAKVVMTTLFNPGSAGARYVAASCKAAGHEVSIIHFKEFRAVEVPTEDEEHHRRLVRDKLKYLAVHRPGKLIYVPYPTPITEREYEIYLEEIERRKPDVVAISMYTVTYEVARQLTELMHERFPGLPVIWGGLHTILAPQQCIETADVVCTNEGEDAFVEFLEKLDNFKAGEEINIQGMWFHYSDGRIVKCAERPLIQNLDKLPFPIYGEDEIVIEDDAISDKMMRVGDFLNAHVYLFTERGCPYKCSYCVHSILNNMGHAAFRRRTVDNVLDEVELRIQTLGMTHFVFHDEIFIIQKPWIMEFARKFRDRFKSRGITFTGYVHPLTTDEEMMAAMFDAGMNRSGMGIQSGSEYTLKKVFDRPYYPDKMRAMTKLLSKYDFEDKQFEIIVNNHYETEEDRRNTLELLLTLEPPFEVETFNLLVYETSKLAEYKPLMEKVDPNEQLFWSSLYHLTSVPEFDRDTIRKMSYDTYLRQNPKVLEKIVVDVYKMYEPLRDRKKLDAVERRKKRVEEYNRQVHMAAASAPRTFRSRLKRKVKSLIAAAGLIRLLS